MSKLDRTFAAIDFETATREHDSACAVAAVVFVNDKPRDFVSALIRPPQYSEHASAGEYPFTYLHGITPADTRKSPPFPAAWERVSQMLYRYEILNKHIVVAHNASFDMTVLRRTAECYDYTPSPFHFACTMRIARSAIPEARHWNNHKPWGLASLSRHFNIELDHHNHTSDAHAAGLLWLKLADYCRMSHAALLRQNGYHLGYLDLQGYKPFSNAQQGYNNHNGQQRRYYGRHAHSKRSTTRRRETLNSYQSHDCSHRSRKKSHTFTQLLTRELKSCLKRKRKPW